jgi:hypothetical protein
VWSVVCGGVSRLFFILHRSRLGKEEWKVHHPLIRAAGVSGKASDVTVRVVARMPPSSGTPSRGVHGRQALLGRKQASRGPHRPAAWELGWPTCHFVFISFESQLGKIMESCAVAQCYRNRMCILMYMYMQIYQRQAASAPSSV